MKRSDLKLRRNKGNVFQFEGFNLTLRENFIGKSQPLTEYGIVHAARVIDVSVATLWAVIEVESAGCGFLRSRRPAMLFERHIFCRRTGGAHNDTNPTISSPTSGGYGGGGEFQYERLAEAIKLDPGMAMMSASWGMPQIMGFNFMAAGYRSIESMINDFCDSEDAQVLALAQYINKFRLGDELRNKDWTAFAYEYNGPGFDATDYDGRLARAYSKFVVKIPNLVIRSQQMQLMFDGYYMGKVDGIAGPVTMAAVEQARLDAGGK